MVLGEECQYTYAQTFKSLQDVSVWASSNYSAILQNSDHVDKVITSHFLGSSINNLLSIGLHSFLLDTWFVLRRNDQTWFAFCEYPSASRSSVNATYCQLPFYLSVWPELLEYQLNQWPYFSGDGELLIGASGMDTSYIRSNEGRFYISEIKKEADSFALDNTSNYLIMLS